jgi:hypothetical protein
MATFTNKHFLSVEEKLKCLEKWKWGEKTPESDECREFYLVNSTIRTICKDRTKIVSRFEQNGLRIKRFRKSERSDVYETPF